ncbi:MAG: cytidine deaminase [Flavobacteriia bacterium]|jgi:cytidine deaminase|nr:cytidine deaminase [Flavobacteriia bacterium]
MQKEYSFKFQLFPNWKSLNPEEILLVNKAFEAMEKAYAPYSKFKVGAALLLEDGQIIQGNNQENIAYPSGLCAERVALFHAGAQFPGIAVDLICIVAKGDLMPISQLLSPCGACRQVMLESENRQNKPIRIILVNQDNRTMCIDSVQNLLPFGFGTFQ